MRKLLLCFVLAFTSSVFAQENEQKAIDSLLKILPKQKESIQKCRTLYSLAENFSDINPQNGIKYADEALKLSTKLNFPEGIGMAYLYKGQCSTVMGEYDKSLALLSKANKLFEDNGDNCRLGLTLLN